MAIRCYKATGVDLNEISITRTTLNEKEVETARLLESKGLHRHVVAAMLGVNMGRIVEKLGPHEDPSKDVGQLEMFGR